MKRFLQRFFLSVSLVAAACSVAADTLVVGHTQDYEPINFMRDGELVGIEVDNARELAKQLGMKLETRIMPFADLVPALNRGDIDIAMAGTSVTAERAENVLFTDPVMDVGQMAIILTDNAAAFAHPRAMYRPGVRIGVEPNTTGHRFAESRLPDSRIQFYADPDTAFAALRANEVDIYIHDAPTSWRLASDRENQDMLSLFRPLSQEQLAWMVKRDNQLLAARVNAVLAQLKATGTLRAIQNFWIPVTVQIK